jgi:hypothetical protein
MDPLKKFFKNGKTYYKPKKPVILKDLKMYHSLPGLDEKDLLDKKQFVEVVLMTSLRVEQNLKELYFFLHCKQTWSMYYEIFELKFSKIVNFSKASGIIDNEDYKIIDKLRKARNEIAHHPHASNKTIDEKKCRDIIVPCFKIIDKTHGQLVKIQGEKKVIQ